MADRERIQKRLRRRHLVWLFRPRRILRWVWRTLRVFYRAADRFMQEDGLYMASALAFSTILAIFPFILFLTAVAGFIGDRELASFLTSTLFDVFPSQVANVLEPEIWNVLIRDRAGTVVTFSIFIMLASVTSAVETIRGGLNRAYGARESRSILRTIPESVAFVVLSALSLIVVAFLGVVFPVVYEIVTARVLHVPTPIIVVEAVRSTVVTLVLAAMLWGFHRWLPAHGRSRPAIWPGIVFTLVVWYLAGQGFSWYMSSVADYARYYAGLAGIVAALLFFYIAAAILLLAGAFNRALHEEWEKRRALRTLTAG